MLSTRQQRGGRPEHVFAVTGATTRPTVRVRLIGLFIVASTLGACTGQAAPSKTSPRPPSGTTSQSVRETPSGPGAWAAYEGHRSCPEGGHSPSNLPRLITAWAGVDNCRILVTSPAGLSAITAEGDLIPLDPLKELDLATAVAAAGGKIWVAGTTRDHHPMLLMFSAGRRTTVPLPAAIAIDAVEASGNGIIVAATIGDHAELLRSSPAGVEAIAALPASATRLAVSGSTVLAGTLRNGEVGLLSGTAPAWHSEALGKNLDIRVVAAADGLLVGAANELLHGVPVAAVFLESRDKGRTWTRHRLAGAELGSMALAGRYIYVSMTRTGKADTLYRSTDAQNWIPVSGAPRSESLPDLAVTDGALWLIGDTITRLPR